MRSKITRSLVTIVLAAVVVAGLPLAAQAAPVERPTDPGFLAALWDRLATPLAALWGEGFRTEELRPVGSDEPLEPGLAPPHRPDLGPGSIRGEHGMERDPDG